MNFCFAQDKLSHSTKDPGPRTGFRSKLDLAAFKQTDFSNQQKQQKKASP
jgi:hypothetical protein